MKTADEMWELERLIADMDTVGCTVTTSKTCVWIGGNTYPIRQDLKRNGWKWSAKKKQWWMTLDRYCGRKTDVNPNEDHTVMGFTADGKPVVITECHFESIA